jgi:N-acetylglucosamine-6-phosphate deacetylase
MRPFRHRDPGIVGAALARDDVVVQLILDGIHVAPDAARIVWRAAAGRLALVTDATSAAGEAGGPYRLGGAGVELRDGVVRGPGGVLAGSVLTMIEAVRNLHALGAPLADALAAASTVPARVLGSTTLGRLDVGLPADLVVLTDELELDRVLVAGAATVVG